jgi:hypothetical protein
LLDLFPYCQASFVAPAEGWAMECLALVSFADEGAGLLVGTDQFVKAGGDHAVASSFRSCRKFACTSARGHTGGTLFPHMRTCAYFGIGFPLNSGAMM